MWRELLKWSASALWAMAALVLADAFWPLCRDESVWRVINQAGGAPPGAVLRRVLRRLGSRLYRVAPGSLRNVLQRASDRLPDGLGPEGWLGLVALAGLAGAWWLWPPGVGGTGGTAAALGRAALGFALGSSGVLAWLHLRAGERCNRILRDLPGLVDLLLLALEGGASLTVALEQASQRLEGPLREELAEVERQTALGLSRRETLEAMADRLRIGEVSSFVGLLNQAESLGSSVTKAVGAVANRLRLNRVLAAERRAGQAPVKMLFPMVFCLFPTILVLLLGPVLIGKGSLLGL